MATTTSQLNPELIPVDCYHAKVQELADAIAQHSVRFRRIALAHLGNVADAEDAIQDAILSALTYVHQFKGQAKMSTWLTAIVINSARMKLRRRSAHVQITLEKEGKDQGLSLADQLSDTRPGPEEIYRNREISETVAVATSRLSPTLRRTFQLRAVKGLSIRETARLLGVPTGTIKARLARARARVREVIKRRTPKGLGQLPKVSLARSQCRASLSSPLQSGH
jgi:RNA polymerase sigma-70 factor, ECF subfamily